MKTTTKDKRISVQMPPHMVKWIEQEAAERKAPISWVIRTIIFDAMRNAK